MTWNSVSANFSLFRRLALGPGCRADFPPTTSGNNCRYHNPREICSNIVCIIVKCGCRKLITIQDCCYIIYSSSIELSQRYSKLQYVTVWLPSSYCISVIHNGSKKYEVKKKMREGKITNYKIIQSKAGSRQVAWCSIMILVYWSCLFLLNLTYTARRLAGPSKTAVIPSTATTPASLPAYLESPLLYSFPVKCS